MATSFKTWLSQVDILLYASHELSLSDVPDEDYYMNYEIGLAPRDMVSIIVESF